MTIKEKLLEEFEAAIGNLFAGDETLEFSEDLVTAQNIDSIARKVKFYMDLD